MKKPISLAHHHKKPNLTEPEKEMEILLKIPPHRIEEPKTGLRIQVSRVYAQAYIKEELWNFYYITYASFFLFGMHWPRISFCVFSPYINFTCPQKKKKKKSNLSLYDFAKHYFTNPINPSTNGKMESNSSTFLVCRIFL